MQCSELLERKTELQKLLVLLAAVDIYGSSPVLLQIEKRTLLDVVILQKRRWTLCITKARLVVETTR